MIKLTFITAAFCLLAACSSMYSGTTSSRDGMNNTATMGSASSMQMGSGPDGSSGGGPN